MNGRKRLDSLKIEMFEKPAQKYKMLKLLHDLLSSNNRVTVLKFHLLDLKKILMLSIPLCYVLYTLLSTFKTQQISNFLVAA